MNNILASIAIIMTLLIVSNAIVVGVVWAVTAFTTLSVTNVLLGLATSVILIDLMAVVVSW